MVISGILTSFVYWSYLTIQNYYSRIQNGQEKSLKLVEIQFRLRKDILEADRVTDTEDGFICSQTGKEIRYEGAPEYLIRTQVGNSDTLLAMCFLLKRHVIIDSIESKQLDLIKIAYHPLCDTLMFAKPYQKTDLSEIQKSLQSNLP